MSWLATKFPSEAVSIKNCVKSIADVPEMLRLPEIHKRIEIISVMSHMEQVASWKGSSSELN
jgi:hypothetical protein